MKKLVLLRHGESQWNLENRFTGWTNVDLTQKGEKEARKAGELLNQEGIEFDVPSPTELNISGIDKQMVGQVAADIRALKKPEPYKGKGIRYAGEHIIRKAGKAVK